MGKLLESGEMYLETILELSESIDFVRSIHIAEKMGYSKASVSRAMANLKHDNYIDISDKGRITLTKSGEEVAKSMYERHRTMSQILIELGVDPEIATRDACRIEHVISPETFDALKKHIAKYKTVK